MKEGWNSLWERKSKETTQGKVEHYPERNLG